MNIHWPDLTFPPINLWNAPRVERVETAMESPCIGVCKLNENQVCIGCHRTLEEIANWSAQTKEESQ